MTSRSRVFLAVAVAVMTFGSVRFVFWPGELARTPYRDATLGSDLVGQFFGDIPTAAWIVGGIVAVVGFLAVIRWPVRKNTDAPKSF